MNKKTKNHLGWTGTLSNEIILSINDKLLRYYFHEKGGRYIPGSLLITFYEEGHGITYHGYQSDKTYQIHAGESGRGLYVLVTEARENVNIANA